MPNLKKPPKKPRSVKLNINPKKSWERILKDVDKREVPIEVLETIIVQLLDGTDVEINIRELLSNGQDPDALERQLNEKFEALDSVISNIDFYVDVDKVAETVQHKTNDLLKNL